MYLTQLHYNMKRCIIQYTFTICSFSVHTNQVFYKCAGLCAGAESEESMKKYIVMASWEGITDTYEDEYSGIQHNSRSEARAELIEAKKKDIDGNTYYIAEKEC